jgi:hypothetical protein
VITSVRTKSCTCLPPLYRIWYVTSTKFAAAGAERHRHGLHPVGFRVVDGDGRAESPRQCSRANSSTAATKWLQRFRWPADGVSVSWSGPLATGLRR